MTKRNTSFVAFLDRDGVINEDTGYCYRVEDLRILPGVSDALSELKKMGFLIVVVTNQSGIARGYFTSRELEKFHENLQLQLLAENSQAIIDKFYFCPHHPQGKIPKYARSCNCRKPSTGLVDQALEELPVSREVSFLVGDKASDIQCAKNVGISAIQVRNKLYPKAPNADHYCFSLAEAVSYIKLTINQTTNFD